ncbi:hypothetical protein LWC34_19710 [Kibdelosporangium philippinense]|uniref:Uncharacterized protein n=1 Tax=Kibdelosporangium philippinense TaxID=211113 RepID=A0ABS8ZGS7_9PSEU|nr:hypothetical protein [Kibdelosporangium philippinense]MCE7005037.1 hypothetical protein [Kibdelosporangium philippinense]
MLGLLSRTVGDGRRAKRALRSAQVLDEVVEAQLALVSRLPEGSRRRAADYLAELVMLAQSYRHFAAGWITRKELEKRGATTMQRLSELRRPHEPAQFTEQD